jgi:hypothetical protein
MEIVNGLMYNFSLKGRKEKIQGIVIDTGIEWIKLKYNPVDFIIDGYKIIRKKYINSFYREKDILFVEAVLKAKKITFSEENQIPLDSIESIFKYLYENQIIFQFDLNDPNVCFIGRISSLKNKSFVIKNLDTSGQWMEERSYRYDTIRTIEIKNDYLNSLIAYNLSIG